MSTTATRHFWSVMQYQCDKCRRRVRFYLEDGCEGPRDREAPVPQEWEYMRKSAPMPLPETVPQTAGGRYVLPVPFIAGACRKCQPGGPPYSLGSGIMQHVDWRHDQRVDTTEVPADAGRFLYPSDWWAERACGEPVFPSEKGRAA